MKYFRPLLTLSILLCPLLLAANPSIPSGASQNLDPAILQPGDILITFDSNIPGWYGGHTALVVDAEEGKILEATCIGEDSVICSLGHWRDYSSFAVLRLRGVSMEERQEVADYAAGNLVNLPYRLTAGILPRAAERLVGGMQQGEAGMDQQSDDTLTGTHCSHLIWYAYRHFGYDLDSNGGLIVTPRDLYNSPQLEKVCVATK